MTELDFAIVADRPENVTEVNYWIGETIVATTVKLSNAKPFQIQYKQLVVYKGQKGQVLSLSTEYFAGGAWSQTIEVVCFPRGNRITFKIESAQEIETPLTGAKTMNATNRAKHEPIA
jgi:hypothetical protein